MEYVVYSIFYIVVLEALTLLMLSMLVASV